MIPKPTQIEGAKFLAARKHALLADEPRVGKTGAAIMAADMLGLRKILVITTASGRAVWRQAWPQWCPTGYTTKVVTKSAEYDPAVNVTITGWPNVISPDLRSRLLRETFDLLILDESHYAKSMDTKRTQAVLGAEAAIASRADRVWYLTGTPIPHSPADLYPMLRFSFPDLIQGLDANDFLHRYCVVRMKQISQWNRIPVVIGGKNLEELRERIAPIMLRRTQADVGIQPPIFDIMPLVASSRELAVLEKDIDKRAILEAAREGRTKELDVHLGPLRRLTGEIKATAAVAAVKEAFECGLDKIVLMAWHKDAIRILADGLKDFGPVVLDGSTSPKEREAAETLFREEKDCRVFIGQIVAAGEAIDLSAAAELWFVEMSFTPKDVKQAALRITNHNQTRQALVRVCALEGSIDEALQASLLRLVSTIREVIEK